MLGPWLAQMAVGMRRRIGLLNLLDRNLYAEPVHRVQVRPAVAQGAVHVSKKSPTNNTQNVGWRVETRGNYV